MCAANVAIVVNDLDAAVAFSAELGLRMEGTGQVEGPSADRTIGLDGVRSAGCSKSVMPGKKAPDLR